MNKDNDSFQVRYIMLRTKVFDLIDKSNILKGLAYVLMCKDEMVKKVMLAVNKNV